MFKESYNAVQLVFLVIASFGFYTLYTTAWDNVFSTALIIVSAAVYLFLGIKIRSLLPHWQKQIIWFIAAMWAIGIIETFWAFMDVGSWFSELPFLLLGVLFQSIIPLYLIWNIRRLASGGTIPPHNLKRSRIYLGILVVVFSVFALYLFSLTDIP